MSSPFRKVNNSLIVISLYHSAISLAISSLNKASLFYIKQYINISSVHTLEL